MINKIFELQLSVEKQGQKITAMTLSLNCSDNIKNILSQNHFMSILFSQYPSLTTIERNFLNYWKFLLKESKKKESLNLKSPFSAELLQFLGTIPTKLELSDGEQSSITISSKNYTPKIHLDIAQSKIFLMPQEKSLLLPGTIPLVIHNNQISPLNSIFHLELIELLYLNKTASLSIEESSFLMNELKNSNSPLNKTVSVAEIVKSEKITPIFEFNHLKNENKFEISLFLEAIINNNKELFSLDLENAKKFLDTHQAFVLNGNSGDKALLIEPQSDISNKIKEIVNASFQNFYSVLGEISENKIITKDRINLFEHFLPKISEHVEIYTTNHKKKLRFVLADEAPDMSIKKTSSTPLFGSNDWLAINFNYNHQSIKLSLKDLEQIIQQGFVETDNVLVTLPEEHLDPIKKLLELRKIDPKSQEMNIQACFLPWILSLYPQAEIPEEWKDLKSFIQNNELPVINLPEHAQGVLRDYQKIGVKRLSLLHHFGFGAVLADEMGLGKTLQILALLDLHRKEGKALIVTPSALTLNWFAEIQKFYPNQFKTLIVKGSKAERDKKLEELTDYDIIITSYYMLSADLDQYKKFDFSFLIIDEAQHIKNKKAKRSKSVKSINARTKIAVSGTPLENNISELWSIFDFIMPGFLGTAKEFQNDYEEPLKNFDSEKRKSTLEKLYHMSSPFVIRRTKATVYKELPAKIEQTITTELTEKQKTLYLETLSRVRNHFFTIVEEKGFNQSRIDFLSALTKLRQIALHPGLVYPELAKLDADTYSAKMTILLELLHEAFDSKHRVLIFSQFVSMLELIKHELIKQDIEFLYIDGKTNNRVELSEEFNQGIVPVFLISLKAGGVGLNLTGADTVILFDPWWNPAVENQAIDRAHRIGQEKIVNVYRLMTKGTIEEKIHNLQRQKDLLFDKIMQENSDFGTFSSEDLLSLLNNEDL